MALVNVFGAIATETTLAAVRDKLPTLSGGSVPVTGALTDAQLRASAVTVAFGSAQAVTGPLTDAQLRASAVPVSGPLTDAQLRATAVPVSVGSIALPTGAATEATLATLNGKVPPAGQATMSQSQPVAIASDQSPVPIAGQPLSTSGTLGALNATVALALSGTTGFVIDVRGTFVGTITFQVSVDGGNWIACSVSPVGAAPSVAMVTTTTAVGAWMGSAAGAVQVRAIMTAYTSGSANITIRSNPSTQMVHASLTGTPSVSISGNPILGASAARTGFVASSGIWYDDSSTALAANATFTGTARDATVTATATAFANASTYAQEIRISAESDQSGTLWLEVSRDNVNWRRVKSVATAAVTGGGQYAEIVHRPSWRYWRVGYTNGATIQARFTIGSIALAV